MADAQQVSSADARERPAPGATAAPGWYPDPLGHFPHRYWSGSIWTSRTAWSGALYDDPAFSGPEPDEIIHLDYLQAYLHGAIQRGVVRERDVRRLLDEIRAWEQLPHLDPPAAWTRAASTPAPAVAAPTTVVAPQPLTPQPATPLVAPAAQVPPTTRRPGVVRQRLTQLARSISADLAVHWFADLGALLLFVGLFGFVAFAFADVSVGLRPVAELAIPVTLFGVAAVLRRRGTPAVADVLVLLGGALLPVVLIAAFSDGASPPPDLEGAALTVALTAVLATVSAVMAVVAHLVPRSPVRYLVAPIGWLAVAAAGLGIGRSVPTGSGLSTPTAAQWAIVLVAVATTAVTATRWRSQRWASAALSSCRPGVVVALVVATAAAGTAGWPPVPVLVGAAAAVVTLEVLGRRWVLATTSAQAVVAVGAAVALAVGWSAGWVAVGALVVALAGAEVRARQDAPTSVRAALVMAGGIAWTITLVELRATPWAAVTAGAIVWTWSILRHHGPAVLSPNWAPAVRGGVIWVAPAAVAVPLTVATDAGVAQVTLVGLLLTVTTALRLRPDLVDGLWSAWAPAASAGAALWLAATWPPSGTTWHVAAWALVAACAVAPSRPVLRLWIGAAGTALAVSGVLWRADVSQETAAVVVSALGLTAVLVSELRRTRTAGHLGAVGLLAAGIASLLAEPESLSVGTPEPLVAAVSATALAVALVGIAVGEELRGTALADLFERIMVRLGGIVRATPSQRSVLIVRRLPLAAAVAVTALTIPGWFEWSGLVAPESAWLTVVAIGSLTVAVVAARLIEPLRRHAAMVIVPDAVVMSCLLALFTVVAPGPWSVALGLIAVQPLLAGRRLRRAALVWIGWLSGALLVPALADLLELRAAVTILSMATIGGLVAIGALGVHQRRAANAESPEHGYGASTLAPTVAGLGLASVALVLAPGQGATVSGWTCVIAAGVGAVVVVLVHWPWASSVPWTLALTAWGLLAPVDVIEQPGAWIPAAAALAVAAEVLRPEDRSTPWTRSWDLPALAVAALAGLLAMGFGVGAGSHQTTATWCGVGALAIAVGVRRRWLWTVVAGAVAVMVGSAVAGPGWLAATLLLVSLGAAVGVVRSSGSTQMLWRCTTAASGIGSWLSFLAWLEWAAVPSATATTLVAATVLCATVIVVGLGMLDRAGALTTGVPATATVVIAGLWWLTAATMPEPSGWLVALAVGASAVAVAFSANPMGQPWMRETGAVAWLAVVGFVVMATAPTLDQVSVGTTTLGLGSTAAVFALGLRARAGTWRRPLMIDATALLALGVATSAGAQPMTGTFALGATAVVAVAVAVSTRSTASRVVAQVIAAIAAPLAWRRGIDWAGWPPQWSVPATGVLGALALVGLAAVIRRRQVDTAWSLTVLVPASVLVMGSVIALGTLRGEHPAAGLGVALAVALVAVAAGRAAAPLDQAWLRLLATTTALGSLGIAADAVSADRRQMLALAAAVALAATVVMVSLSLAGRATAWLVPLEAAAVLATAAAWGLLEFDVPEVLATALLLTGLEMAAVGVVRRQEPLVLASPWILCAAWVVVARSTFGGEAVWITVPVGATVLVTVTLARSQQRSEQQPVGSPLLSTLELIGVAVMAVTPLAQAVVGQLANAAVALGIGIGVTAWGALTKVRRRLLAGTAVIGLSALVMLVVPMVDLSRRLTGSAIWLAVAAVGLAAIIVAALLEQSRRATRRAVARLRELTDGWE